MAPSQLQEKKQPTLKEGQTGQDRGSRRAKESTRRRNEETRGKWEGGNILDFQGGLDLVEVG